MVLAATGRGIELRSQRASVKSKVWIIIHFPQLYFQSFALESVSFAFRVWRRSIDTILGFMSSVWFSYGAGILILSPKQFHLILIVLLLPLNWEIFKQNEVDHMKSSVAKVFLLCLILGTCLSFVLGEESKTNTFREREATDDSLGYPEM